MLLSETSTKAPKDFDKKEIKEKTIKIVNELVDLQKLLYAESKYSVLVILQGMDASGKDGAISGVFGQLNPQGVNVKSYKAPTDEELSHDFLWRIHKNAPAKGYITVFNRSHYEDVLITRVKGWCDDATAEKRFEAINDFEKLLMHHNNTLIFKFYLHISKEEQNERLQERITDPAKQWKYNAKDFEEAKSWDKYMQMYEKVFLHSGAVPWVIVPSGQNWYKEFLIASTIRDGLKKLNMKYPANKEIHQQYVRIN
jgi:PPK2 family polyphosphate:nucleotide phosphotransferase